MKKIFYALFLIGFMCTSCEESTYLGFDYTLPVEDNGANEDDNEDRLVPINPVLDIEIFDSEDNDLGDKILPLEWGQIEGAGISAVPADAYRGSYAMKCLTIRTEHGAVAVVFDMEEEFPSFEDITNAFFVEGNFGEEYNGGVYLKENWEPAISVDMDDRIAYFQGDTCMRNVRFTTLEIWGWRDGNLSTVVENYHFQAEDGLLSVYYDGECIAQIR